MNFHELAQKLRRIDEGSVVECGDMMPGAMMASHAPMPQQDTVSMNVSMNATGKGGIRDLMNVLQNIESAVNHGDMYKPLDISSDEIEMDIPSADSMMGGEVHIEPEMDEPEMDADDSESPIDGDEFGGDDTFDGEDDTFGGEEPSKEPAKAKTIDPAVAAVVGYLASKNKKSNIETVADESSNFENRPDPSYQSQNYMTNTLAGGADEPQRMTKHGYGNGDNPLAMKESLQSRLANLYQEVKLRESVAHEDRDIRYGQPMGTPAPARANPTRPRPPTAIDPVSNNPVNMKPQSVAPQANRPGLAPNGDPKLWDIQHELQKRGYKIRPDGLNGPATQKAAADAGMIDAIRQDVANPKAADGGFSVGHAIGSGIGWIETAWRNLQTGLSRGRAGLEESADLEDIKKLSGLNH